MRPAPPAAPPTRRGMTAQPATRPAAKSTSPSRGRRQNRARAPTCDGRARRPPRPRRPLAAQWRAAAPPPWPWPPSGAADRPAAPRRRCRPFVAAPRRRPAVVLPLGPSRAWGPGRVRTRSPAWDRRRPRDERGWRAAGPVVVTNWRARVDSGRAVGGCAAHAAARAAAPCGLFVVAGARPKNCLLKLFVSCACKQFSEAARGKSEWLCFWSRTVFQPFFVQSLFETV